LVHSASEFVNKSVAAHKKLRGGIVFVPAIPKTASGKILRRVLRDQARAEAAAAKQK
jgi:acyl-coenzyme A synthetase/AMP-(fatty) acid ligase